MSKDKSGLLRWIVGGTCAVLVVTACFFWYRSQRETSLRKWMPDGLFVKAEPIEVVSSPYFLDNQVTVEIPPYIEKDGRIMFSYDGVEYGIYQTQAISYETCFNELPKLFFSVLPGEELKLLVNGEYQQPVELPIESDLFGYVYAMQIPGSIRKTTAYFVCYACNLQEGVATYFVGVTIQKEKWKEEKQVLDKIIGTLSKRNSGEDTKVDLSVCQDEHSFLAKATVEEYECPYEVQNGILYVYWYNYAQMSAIKAFGPDGKQLERTYEYPLPDGDLAFLIGKAMRGTYWIEYYCFEEPYGIHLEVYEKDDFQSHLENFLYGNGTDL